MIALALAIGCGPGSSPSSTDGFPWTPPPQGTQPTDTQTTDTQTTDTQTTAVTTNDTSTTPSTLPTGLNGTAPAQNLVVPTFSQVLADDGTARASADLLGMPTVMWFYPAAATGG